MSELKVRPYTMLPSGQCYDRDEVNKFIAEKDAEIAELKARIQLDDDEMAGFLQLEEECGGGDLRNYIAELKQKLDKAIAERDGNQVCIDALNEKLGAMNEFIKASKELLLESQKMHKRCADNAVKEIRRLRRALCRLRIGFAKHFGRVNSGKRIVAYWKAMADEFKEAE